MTEVEVSLPPGWKNIEVLLRMEPMCELSRQEFRELNVFNGMKVSGGEGEDWNLVFHETFKEMMDRMVVEGYLEDRRRRRDG